MVPPLREGPEPRGGVQSNHCKGKGWVRLSDRSLLSKLLVSRQIIAGGTLNAVSDGDFACRMHFSLCGRWQRCRPFSGFC